MPDQVYVWDKFVRLFHWSLALLFIVCYVTGEDESWLHIYSGYAILGLVFLRVVWGFIGTRYARFKDFVFSPISIFEYAKSTFKGSPRHFLGHNPLGGLMVVTLLIALILTTLSGLKLYAIEEGKGPFAGVPEIQLISSSYADSDDDDDDDDEREREREHEHESRKDGSEDFWEDVHEAFVNLLIFLIILHVIGVAISSRIHNESLVKAMITGYKKRQ